MRHRLGILAAVLSLALATPALAGHHLWDITEIYSNGDGSVQFVELFTADNNEQGVGPFNVTASGNTASFGGVNLPTSATANTWILMATSNFASQSGGITPDYLLPTHFFNTGGGTMNYAGVDIWAYGKVPTDGVNSLQRNGSTAVNSPRNFAGASGSVNLGISTPGFQSWGLILLVGALLLAASGLLRRRPELAA